MASSSKSGSESDDYKKKKKRKSKKKKVHPQVWALYMLAAKYSRIRTIFQAIKPLLVRYLVSTRKLQCHSTSCGGSHCYIHPKERNHFPLSHSHFSLWAAAIVSGCRRSNHLFPSERPLGQGRWFFHCWNTAKLSNLWLCPWKLKVLMLSTPETSGQCTGQDISPRTCDQLQYATRVVRTTPSNASKPSTPFRNDCFPKLAAVSSK